MAITWLTPGEITPGTPDDWIDADVSGSVPAGATGVILHVETDDAVPAYFNVGWRKNGSSDARTAETYGDHHFWCAVGVDANRILELYVEDTTVVSVWLVGYFSDDAVFFTNAVGKSLEATLEWTDIDISADTEADTAIGALLEIIDTTYGHDYGLRKNGSSDARACDSDRHCGAIVGCDGSEIFEGYISDLNTDFFLVGYVTKESSFNTNATNLSLDSTGSWIDLSALPAGATGGFIEVVSGAEAQDYGLRKNGASENILAGAAGEQHAWGMVEADGSRLIEGQISDLAVDFFLVGYSEAAMAAALPVLSEAPPRLSLLVYDFDGRGKRLERALRRRWSSHYRPDGSGFGYLMFSLDRKLGFDYRDIGYNYRIQLCKGLATVLFDGLIKNITENQADPDRLDVTALGWNVVAGDDAFNWVFCDTRYMMWRGSETPSGSFRPDTFDYDQQDRIQFKPRRGVDYAANDYTRLRYVFQFGEVAERIKFDWNVALPGSWPGKVEVRDSNGVVLWSKTTTGNGTGVNLTTTGSPTYFEVRFYVTTAGENTAEDGTVYARLTNVKVFGVDDTVVDGGVVAKKVHAAVLAQSYHGLSTSTARIASPARALDAASAFDTDLSPEQIMSHICKFGDANGNPLAWGVDMDNRQRLFLETMDLTTIRYVILRESALQAQVAGDVQQSHQKVYGVWTDTVGEVHRSADRIAQAAIDALGGYARRRALPVDGATEEAQVLQAVDLYLAEKSMPEVTSSFTVRGNVYTPALNPVPFDEIKAGGMVQVRDFRAREATLSPNDFRDQWTTFQLVGVEVDEDAHTVRLIPAGDRAGFEQYMALLAQLREG